MASWPMGNPANPASAAGQCLASASTGYNYCAPNGAAITAARPYATQFPYLSYVYGLSNSNVSNYNSRLQAVIVGKTPAERNDHRAKHEDRDADHRRGDEQVGDGVFLKKSAELE